MTWNKLKPIPGSFTHFFCVKHRFFYSLGGYKHAYDRVFWLLHGLLWVMCYPLLVFMIVLNPKHVRLAESGLKLSLESPFKARHAEKQKVCIDFWVVKPYIFWLVYDVFQVILDTLVGLAGFLGPVFARDG